MRVVGEVLVVQRGRALGEAAVVFRVGWKIKSERRIIDSTSDYLTPSAGPEARKLPVTTLTLFSSKVFPTCLPIFILRH